MEKVTQPHPDRDDKHILVHLISALLQPLSWFPVGATRTEMAGGASHLTALKQCRSFTSTTRIRRAYTRTPLDYEWGECYWLPACQGATDVFFGI